MMEMEEGVVGGLPLMESNEGIISSFAEQDIVDHRQVYVGLHHRPAEKSRRGAKFPKFVLKKTPKMFRWENGKRIQRHSYDSASDTEREVGSLPPPAAERVKFILGGDHEEEKILHGNPHLFTELEELFVCVDGNIEWKETARWNKYEEDVEEGGDRWSKPHVATLSLYSLLELRSSLMAGTVMLDLDATTLSGISDLVLDNLISCNKLAEIVRSKVRETLLRKHRHQRNSGFRRNLSNIISSRKSLNMLHQSAAYKLHGKEHVDTSNTHTSNGHVNNGSSKQNLDNIDPHIASSETKFKFFRNFSQPTFPNTSPVPLERMNTVQERMNTIQGHLVYPNPSNTLDDDTNEKVSGFMKKLPLNSEASNILVGDVDFLEKPITAFVRLATSAVIEDLTEVPIPTRFLFIMLGPCISPGRYHEIGRAISTLMADEVFHEVAYKAKSREDLIAGIDEFLEQVTVLPPGEWDPSIRIDPPANGCAKLSRRATTFENKDALVEQHGSGTSDNAESIEGESAHVLFRQYKPFGGLLADLEAWKLRRRDIRDGFSLKCIGTVFFIYFSLLAVIMTVGDHEEHSSGGYLGIREHLLSLAITGIPFVIFSGQPMLIISFTLPLSLFDRLLYKLCIDFNLDYLPTRLWVGIWTMMLLFLFVVFNVSKYLHYLTRFTLEIFIVLSPLVLLGYGFFYTGKMLTEYSNFPGSFTNHTCLCVQYVKTANSTSNNSVLNPIIQKTNFRECHLNGWILIGDACQHDVIPYTIFLTVSTILFVLFLSSFQRFGCLPSKIHQFFHDFATVIAIIFMSLIANQFDVNIAYLQLPKNYEPRTTWFVSPLGSNHLWIILLAFIPAVFLTLLIFVEQQVTACCINHKDKRLEKEHGYHLDLLLVLAGVGISSALGLPFSVASIVLSLNHIHALKDKNAEDDFIGSFISVREQRLTGVFVYILIVLSPSLRALLNYIPVPALYGIFILVICRTFLGVQFAKRVTLLFIRKERQPDLVYLRQVPFISVNIMTLVQLVGLLLCVSLRATLGAVVFPVMIFFLVVTRLLLEHLLPIRDILALDEPMFKFSLQSKKSESSSKLITDVETGALPEGGKSHGDVLPENIIPLDRVNLSEELSKTAVWKQLNYENSNSPHGNSSKDDSADNKRRRKKRNREHKKDKNNSPSIDRRSSCSKQSTENEIVNIDSENAKLKRKISKEHPSSKRQSQERNPFRRHEPSERDSVKKTSVKRQSSHDRKHKSTKARPQICEEAPLPPWAQPYHSPPTKDFGLLKIPDNDWSIDPACSRSDSVKSQLTECSNAPSQTNSNKESRANILEEAKCTNIIYSDNSRDASSEPDDI